MSLVGPGDRADERPAQRLRGRARARRADDGHAAPAVVLAERQRGEDLAAGLGRGEAVAGEAEAGVHGARRASSRRRAGRVGEVHGAAPGGLEAHPFELREEPDEAAGRHPRDARGRERPAADAVVVGDLHGPAADGDAPVVGGPQVEEHLAEVGDAPVRGP